MDKTIKYFIILAIVIFLGVGCFFAWQQGWIPMVKPSVLDETADWKTYSSLEYKITFKYPPDWEIKSEYLRPSAPLPTIVLGRRGVTAQSEEYNINEILINKYQTYCIGYSVEGGVKVIRESIKGGEIELFEYKEGEYPSGCQPKGCMCIQTNVPIIGAIVSYFTNPEVKDIFKKVALSFKVTEEEETETENWKTYKDANGLVFDYPSDYFVQKEEKMLGGEEFWITSDKEGKKI